MAAGYPPAPLRVLLHGQFGIFAAGNGLSLIGTWMQRIACSWLIWDWTGSAFWLGVLAAGDLLPVVVVAPFAGVAADRWDRLLQNRIAQAISAGLALLLAGLLLADALNIVTLIACVTLQGTLIAAVQPARLAMIQQMVPRADMAIAVALNSVNVNLARLLGPAAAGLMIVHLDIVWVFVLNAAVTMAFVIVLGRLKLAPREAPPPRGAMLAQMRDGLAFILAEPALRTILAVLLTGGLLVRSVLELVPAIAAETFASAATGLAVLTGAAAAGAVVSGLTVRDRDAGTLLRGVLIWWAIGAIAAILMTQAPDHWLAVPAAVLLGAAITRGLVGTQTYVQLATPDALRGRVLSFHGLIARGSPAIGALAIGYGADRLGLPVSVTAASVALLLVVGAIALAPRG